MATIKVRALKGPRKARIISRANEGKTPRRTSEEQAPPRTEKAREQANGIAVKGIVHLSLSEAHEHRSMPQQRSGAGGRDPAAGRRRSHGAGAAERLWER